MMTAVSGPAARGTQNRVAAVAAPDESARGSRAKSDSPGSRSGAGVIGVYNSDDLTFAASIAYYALLSLFPFFLLAFSLIGSVTTTVQDRQAMLGLRAALLSRSSSSS